MQRWKHGRFFFDHEAPQTHRVSNMEPFKSPCLLNGWSRVNEWNFMSHGIKIGIAFYIKLVLEWGSGTVVQ